MIFLTIGTQLPFDRLVRTVDLIAPSLNLDVFAQIGGGNYLPVNFPYARNIAPKEFDAFVKTCDFIVSHAGIGSVLTAQRHQKPIVLFPRLSALGEHRNNHQLATCDQLQEREGIYVARNEEKLKEILAYQGEMKPQPTSATSQSRADLVSNLEKASSELINSLKSFNGGKT